MQEKISLINPHNRIGVLSELLSCHNIVGLTFYDNRSKRRTELEILEADWEL